MQVLKFHGRYPNETHSPTLKIIVKGGEWDEQRQPKMQPSAEIVRVERAKCRRECDLSGPRATLCGDRACRVLRSAGKSAICPVRARPSAEIVRVECSKCRRECDLSHARGALCGDRACGVREVQARVRLVRAACDPLRRSCVSSVQNAGESAICPVRARPSAEIVRVKCSKCRRECDLSDVRATLCGDRACRVRDMQARVRFGDLPLHFWRTSRTKRSFWRLAASLLEEVSYEALVLETCRFTFGGSLVRSARFGDLPLQFWRKYRTKRALWRRGASLLEEVLYETLVLETWHCTCGAGLRPGQFVVQM